jgi:coenzyme F420-0:L-glutamate ligase / coenzyme F420-1:gamma-L-glutamate ligase
MSNYNSTPHTLATPLRLQAPEALHPFHQLILSRRSIRNFRPDPVPPDLVNDLLVLAGRAPSSHNRQPWRWVVVHTEEAKQRLVEAMAEEFRRDLERDGLSEEKIEPMLARSRQRIGGAPIVVVPCLSMEEMDHYPDHNRQRCEWQMGVQSVALACQNLLLGAHAVGLGGCWICAPIFCVPAVQRALDLPLEWEPQGLLTLGWPADNGREREKKAVQSIALYR